MRGVIQLRRLYTQYPGPGYHPLIHRVVQTRTMSRSFSSQSITQIRTLTLTQDTAQSYAFHQSTDSLIVQLLLYLILFLQ